MQLRVNSRTTGGTGYLARVLRCAQKCPISHVDIIVNEGACQDEVYTSIKKQLDLLHSLADVYFTHTLVKDESCME